MIRQTDGNANSSLLGTERSRRARQSWRVIPTDTVRPMRAMNGSGNKTSRNAMANGQLKKKTTLDPGSLVSAAALLGSVGSLKAAEKTEKVVHSPPEQELYEGFPFPFENLVFEGGGNKGMAYVGALQILEDARIMGNIKRVAGASAGAIIATLIALEFTSEELKEFLEQDLRRILVDHSCGYCSLLPNLLKGFGWNPGKKMLKWFGEQLKERTGDADVTFKEVHERFGKELCIVVTNLSQMAVEYFHPKTTPNTPIRRAVRMSVALPGVFQCVREMNSDYEDVYVDGGLLCNYPIHAFDGWWLSMDPRDTFFKKLQPLEDFARLFEKSERFGKWNEATLGIILYSHTETELMKTLLSEREGNKPPPPPNTKISRQRLKLQQQQAMMHSEHQAMVRAVGRFMKELQRNNLDEDSIINIQELKGAFRNPIDFTREDAELLFGPDADYRTAFEELDTDEDGEITFQELMAFIERKGVNLQTRFLGYSRKDIKHLGEFISTLQTALSVNVKRVYVEKKDVERTIGIDTDYIETTDFNLEPGDKKFLIESGKRATRAFLREYVSKEYAKQMYDAAELPESDERVPLIKPVQPVQPVQPVIPKTVSVESLSRSPDLDPLARSSDSRLSGTFRLPPLDSYTRQSSARSERNDSGQSVRSTRKVSLDIQKSPRVKHRTAKVYSETNLRS